LGKKEEERRKRGRRQPIFLIRANLLFALHEKKGKKKVKKKGREGKAVSANEHWNLTMSGLEKKKKGKEGKEKKRRT